MFAHPGDSDWKQGHTKWIEPNRENKERAPNPGAIAGPDHRYGRRHWHPATRALRAPLKKKKKRKDSSPSRSSRSRSPKKKRRGPRSEKSAEEEEKGSRRNPRRKRDNKSPEAKERKNRSRSRSQRRERGRKSPTPAKTPESQGGKESENGSGSPSSPESGSGGEKSSESTSQARKNRDARAKANEKKQRSRRGSSRPSEPQIQATTHQASEKRRSRSQGDESSAQSGSSTRPCKERIKYKDLADWKNPVNGEGVMGNWDAMRYVVYLHRTNTEELWHPSCDPARSNLKEGDFDVAGNTWYGREVLRWQGEDKRDRKLAIAELEAAVQLVMTYLASGALRKREVRDMAQLRAGSPTAQADDETAPEEKKKRKELKLLEKQARAAQRRAVTARALFERVFKISLRHLQKERNEFQDLTTYMLPIHLGIRITTVKDAFSQLGWSMNVYRRRCSQGTVVPRRFPEVVRDPFQWHNSDSDPSP